MHVLLTRDSGLKASHDALRRYAIEELGWERPPTVRLDDPCPGQETQVDFGHLGEIVDADCQIEF